MATLLTTKELQNVERRASRGNELVTLELWEMEALLKEVKGLRRAMNVREENRRQQARAQRNSRRAAK